LLPLTGEHTTETAVMVGFGLTPGEFGYDGSMFIEQRRQSSIVGDHSRNEIFRRMCYKSRGF